MAVVPVGVPTIAARGAAARDFLRREWTTTTSCPASLAMSSFRAGDDWADAVALAERALDRGCCEESPACAWRALTTLVGAGELDVADASARRVAHRAVARGRVAEEVMVLRGRIARRRGDFDRRSTCSRR